MITDVIGAHPEYQPMVSDAQAALAFEPGVSGAENPFLHMGCISRCASRCPSTGRRSA